MYDPNDDENANVKEERTCQSEAHGRNAVMKVTLNSDLTCQDVEKAVKQVNANKTAEPNGVIQEVSKCAHV